MPDSTVVPAAVPKVTVLATPDCVNVYVKSSSPDTVDVSLNMFIDSLPSCAKE